MSEFLASEYPEDKEWMGFFKMWLDARGYRYTGNETGVVDGPRDAGIDAIAFAPAELSQLEPVVVQSKYFTGEVPERQLRRFINTVKLFRNGKFIEFEKWLKDHVRESLKPKYQSLCS